MVTDKMLQQAAGEVELAMLNSLAAKDVEPHPFSPHFEKKMKKLINRVKHPIRYNALRSAAAIILIIFTLFGALMAFSPQARAKVIEYFKETFGGFVQYAPIGNSENAGYNYRLAAVPEGYRELQTVDLKDGKSYLYANDIGKILNFTYVYGTRQNTMFIKTESYTQVEGTINGVNADIYITSNENEASVIVWKDPETGTLLCIHAHVGKDMLIAMAESVMKTKK
ncbi:MAG: DUF4367 domain-containing protein [Ruminococcaceae bacterium]|nr:DUF4367 domain-containing protein [Oscillospiraceae bacterium]